MGPLAGDGRDFDYLGGGDAAVDSDSYSVRGKWQRDGRYYPADSLPGDHPGDQLRHGPLRYTLGRDSIIGLLQRGESKNWIYGQRAGFDHDGRAFRQLRQNQHAVKKLAP